MKMKATGGDQAVEGGGSWGRLFRKRVNSRCAKRLEMVLGGGLACRRIRRINLISV